MTVSSKQLAEIIGVGAVVFSLLFVAYELSLSNTIATRESRTDILSIWYDMNRLQYEDPDVASLLVKLKDPTQTLNEEENSRAVGLARTYITIGGLINASNEAELIPSDILEIHMNVFRVTLDEYPNLVPFFKQTIDLNTAYRSANSVVWKRIVTMIDGA